MVINFPFNYNRQRNRSVHKFVLACPVSWIQNCVTTNTLVIKEVSNVIIKTVAKQLSQLYKRTIITKLDACLQILCDSSGGLGVCSLP